jgi:tetratricopeptide (TPR) repeat protein
MGSGQLRDVILRELGSRPIFVLILSKNAIASRWVKREADWAEELIDRDPSRVFLPVTAAPIERTDFGTDNGWLAYYGYKRIEAPGFNPYAVQEAANRLLHALALTPVGEIPPSVAPQPSESVDDLITRGRALNAQRHYAEALPLFQPATQLAPGSFDAWFNTGYTLELLEHYDEALVADEHATALDPKSNAASFNEGNARTGLGRYEEALAAYERNFDANDARDWRGKGNALRNLSRYEEALAAYERAVTLDPTHAVGWTNKGITLDDLGRREEALAAYVRGFDPNDARDWRGKARCLRALGRTTEAAEAERRAKELDG